MLLEYGYMENGNGKLTTGILANENIIQTQSKVKVWYDEQSMDMLPLVLTVVVWFAQQFILDLAPHEVQFAVDGYLFRYPCEVSIALYLVSE